MLKCLAFKLLTGSVFLVSLDFTAFTVDWLN